MLSTLPPVTSYVALKNCTKPGCFKMVPSAACSYRCCSLWPTSNKRPKVHVAIWFSDSGKLEILENFAMDDSFRHLDKKCDTVDRKNYHITHKEKIIFVLYIYSSFKYNWYDWYDSQNSATQLSKLPKPICISGAFHRCSRSWWITSILVWISYVSEHN